ncbi:MAG TPA: ABC transporter ATP-binding protein [Symbiobacteriaceae bacterium]|jgi:putative spermidine/putrescine transport system ATP-binding protein
MSEVRIEHMTKRFKHQAAVGDVSIHVREGEFLTLLGPSGCGKSTTLRMVAGFEAPDEGKVFIGGKDVTNVPARERGVGMVFQSYALFPNLTAHDNVAFGLRMGKLPEAEVKQRVSEMLDTVSLGEHAGKYPSQLSGGMQQRVALARALVRRPSVLLLDEPLSALDAKIRVQLRELIKDLQVRLGTTTIYVTHDQEEALSLSDRVAVMSAGKVVQLGTPAEIYAQPATRFVAGFVGTLNFLPAEIAAGKAVRPEALRLYPGNVPLPPAADELRLAARVIRANLLGTLVRVRLRVGEHELVADTLNTGEGAARWPEGLAVTAGIPAGAVFPVLE